ncbi:TetR family transcriptional regulator [Kribbella sp. VKM Ac-2569]|uniref:TetR/AcrR family transcriptional regulator n=1 Tax=Kribbella sp. VKM Ac-2569 TaxID=2512220 RepID=UPI00102CF55F|nr:TetR/AcrR family transcriptional regulator [Kribbella sp. VKM Ac-2569]RZT27021.1 TetR family transcriptional regulator [Kribbella sp. VKM Ac-2569]
MAEQGLRERKKQATRRMIADVATGLFVTRGFDAVTVAEIAEAAGVSKMTVFNYFPRKEDLYLDRHLDRLRELEAVVRDRPAGEPVTTAMRRYHHELLATGHPLSGAIAGVHGFWSVLQSSPALMSRMVEQEHEIGDMLAGVLAEETDDEFSARLVANLLTATITTIFRTPVGRIVAGDDVEQVRRDQVTVIDRAFDVLEQGIGPRREQLHSDG